MILNVNAKNGSYDVIIERNSLARVGEYFNLNRKVLIVSDSGVPYEYVERVRACCKQPYVCIIEQGEKNKSFDSYIKVLGYLADNSFTRTDAVVAVGGGVVGDLAGFAAATYMRGIAFYNVPTTLLSQVDSSIGGKTAIDFNGLKNIVGAFYQPIGVLIDPETLKTLPERQVRAGLAEAIKMAATSDGELFDFIANSQDLLADIDNIIYRSLLIKKDVVEQDALEKGLRKILNFGHTVGHAIESLSDMQLLHGECVALGMLYMASDNAAKCIAKVLEKFGLPTYRPINKQKTIDCIRHDKKAGGDMIDIVYVENIGSCDIRKIKIDDLAKYL